MTQKKFLSSGSSRTGDLVILRGVQFGLSPPITHKLNLCAIHYSQQPHHMLTQGPGVKEKVRTMGGDDKGTMPSAHLPEAWDWCGDS